MTTIPDIPSEPVHSKEWPPHPPKKMLMTPLMATVGAMLAFVTVVFMVVILPTTTFEPAPSENWRPLTDLELQGRNVFLQNGCIYCHSGFTCPQDMMASQYYVYPRVSEPGDYTGEGESPNLFGTIQRGQTCPRLVAFIRTTGTTLITQMPVIPRRSASCPSSTSCQGMRLMR